MVNVSIIQWNYLFKAKNLTWSITLDIEYLNAFIILDKRDRCRGTVALVHVECLERWLTESGHSRCELCGYKYATKRVPRHNIIRSVVIWFNTVIVTRQVRHIHHSPSTKRWSTLSLFYKSIILIISHIFMRNIKVHFY